MPQDADYTPNPDRAIWIRGELTKSLLERLRPRILDLTSRSREPITVFIDSNGGSTAAGNRIMVLLRSGEDGTPACRIITVGLSKAQSAAADLLSAGDFAIASPGCMLLLHGSSIPMTHPIDSKSASWIAQGMSSLNEKHSISLTRRSLPRFRALVSALRPTFDHVRADAKNSGLSDLYCFQELVRRRLSPGGQKVLKLAADNCGAYRGLLSCFESRMRKIGRVKRADVEKAMFNASAAFEFRTRRKRLNWGLGNGGLRRINSSFFFLDELFGNANGDGLSSICRPSPHTREQDYFHFLPFFLAVAGALQEGENELTATDALWLGLVDTVR